MVSFGVQLFDSRIPLTRCRHFLEISERHTWWGEAFGVFCWLWIFHRARQDLPVVLGFRHAWEHAPGDDYQGHGHHAESDGKESQKNGWDKFSVKAMQQIDDDDDDDDEEEEDDNDDDEE